MWVYYGWCITNVGVFGRCIMIVDVLWLVYPECGCITMGVSQFVYHIDGWVMIGVL